MIENGVKCKTPNYVFKSCGRSYMHTSIIEMGHMIQLIVYALVELIIEASHQTKDYLIVDIHTQHTSLYSMNAIFICVIVLSKMCFHILNLC